jgi:hypothetical protein
MNLTDHADLGRKSGGSGVERSAVPAHPYPNPSFPTLQFNLSSRAKPRVEASAVRGLRSGSSGPPRPSPLSSRPERTRISCFAALNNGHVCDSPQREAHEPYRSRLPWQEIRGERSGEICSSRPPFTESFVSNTPVQLSSRAKPRVEGPAVRGLRSGSSGPPRPSPLSSRPERTRISCFAALNNGHVCDSPQRGA